MKSKAKVFAILAAAFMLLSAIPIGLVTEDSAADGTGSALPSNFRLTDNVTPVRDQGNEGLCWAFAITAAMEGEMINEGLGDKSSTILSPLYESVMQYDATTYSGEGDCNVLNAGELNKVGGYTHQYGFMLSDGKGPMYEYIAPYNEVEADYPIDRTISDSSLILVRQIDYFDAYSDADEIKQMILDGHIGVFSFHAESGKDAAYYRTTTESVYSNHAVALVGWDDNYSKDNFKDLKPEGDGAWIIKNSWGTDIGESGYLYVSYYNEIADVTFLTDVIVNDGSTYLYSYDHGYSILSDRTYRGSATMANVFTAERDETLTGISFNISSTSVLDQGYSVSVYKLRDGYRNATDGELVMTQKDIGIVDHASVSYVDFVNDVQLTEGDLFSVCVEFKGETVIIPIDTTEVYGTAYTSYTVASPGQSYICYDGKWTDVSSDGKSNVRIKAYTSTDITYEASLNGVSYAKLSDALSAADDGDNVRLLGDITCQPIELSKDVVLTLCGYTLTVDVPVSSSVPAIKLSGCDLTVTYGMIKSSCGTLLSANGGALSLDHVKLVNDGTSYPIVVSDTELTTNGLDYSGVRAISIKNGSADLRKSYFTCTADSVSSDGGNVTITDCWFYTDSSTTLSGDGIKVVSGKFKGFNPESFADEGSYKYEEEYSKVLYNVVDMKQVESDSGEFGLQDAIQEGGNVKVLRDLELKDIFSITPLEALNLDLNGHTVTISGNSTSSLIALAELDCTISNSASVVGTLKAESLFSTINAVDGKVIIGDNVQVILGTALYLGGRDYCEISADSDVKLISESETLVDKTVTYTSESGHVKETLKLINKSSYGEIMSIYTGVQVHVTEDSKVTEYHVTDGTVSDADGNVLGSWSRDYKSYKNEDKNSVEDTVDYFTYTDGTEAISFATSIKGDYVLMTGTASATSGGVAEVYTTFYGKSHTAEVSEDMISPAIANNDRMAAKLSEIDYTYLDKNLYIASSLSESKVLRDEVFNSVLSDGTSVGVIFEKYIYVLAAGTGTLSGDTTIAVSKAGYSQINDRQDQMITTGVAYTVTVTVDGEAVNELPCYCIVLLSDIPEDDGVFCTVDEKGNVSSLNSYYLSSSHTYVIELGKNTSFVMNPVGYDNSSAEDTVLWTTVIITAISVAGACLILLRRRL